MLNWMLLATQIWADGYDQIGTNHSSVMGFSGLTVEAIAAAGGRFYPYRTIAFIICFLERVEQFAHSVPEHENRYSKKNSPL